MNTENVGTGERARNCTFELNAWLRDIRDTRIDGTQKLVATMLALRADFSGQCWPSIPRIALDAGISNNTARRAVRDLECIGVIETSDREGQASVYQLQPLSNWIPPVVENMRPALKPRTGPPPKLNPSQNSRGTPPKTELNPSHGCAEPLPRLDPNYPLTTQEEPKQTSRASRPEDSGFALRVFTCWQETHGHEGAKLDSKRKSRIKARLAEGFTVEQLIEAIKNAKNDRFLMGENDHGRKYDGIETLLRDTAQVERLIALKTRAPPPQSRSFSRTPPRQGDHGLTGLEGFLTG